MWLLEFSPEETPELSGNISPSLSGFVFVFRAIPAAMEVFRVESELQLLAYTTATTTPNPSRILDLHHSSQQLQILNPTIEAKD